MKMSRVKGGSIGGFYIVGRKSSHLSPAPHYYSEVVGGSELQVLSTSSESVFIALLEDLIAKSSAMAQANKECLVCANDFDESRVPCYGSCGHDGVCSLCFLRMRALARDMRCPMCKTYLEHVICSDQPGIAFHNFTIWGESCGPDFEYDSKGQMFFPKQYYREKVSALWKSQCSVCQVLRRDPLSLKKHVSADHNLVMCALCIEHKQAFPCEHRLYTSTQFEKHLKKGDGDGSEGHPNCEFCRRRYYDKTALFMHLSKDHFTCFICEREGVRYQYFENYESLERHFKKQHFLCEEKECLAKKFIVFSNQVELVAHTRQFHPFIQVGRSIPLSFHMQRPTSESNLLDYSRNRRDVEFDAGMGGKAKQGEWRVSLSPTFVNMN